jgi:hypothetical protein
MSTTRTEVGSRSVQNVFTGTTEAAPALGEQAGMYLSNVRGYSVHIVADAGQTLTGAGLLRAYLFNPFTTQWSRCGLDLFIPADAAGCEAWSWVGSFPLPPVGRIEWRPESVGVTSGGLTQFIVGDPV